MILQDEASPLPSMEDANAIEPLYDLLEKDSEGVLQTEVGACPLRPGERPAALRPLATS